MALAFTLLLLAVTSWLLARAIRQMGIFPSLPKAAPPAERGAPGIAVIVPARDEAANIQPCLLSLTRQSYPPARLSFVVIDDNSSDGTGELVEAMGAEDPRILRLPSGPLEPGWTGKCQACWAGARQASPTATWLCFVDADMRADPGLIASAVAAADDIALLSLSPRHQLLSFAERLMIPCGLYLLAFRQNLSRLQAPGSDEVTATGQFMLIRRDVYEAVGGHSAVRGEICEDLELARLIKRAGGRVVLMDASRMLSTRMYEGWSTLWPGFAKNVVDMFGGAVATLTTAIAAILVSVAAWIAPLMAFLAWRAGAPFAPVALALAGMNAAIVIGFHVAGAIFLGVPFGYGLLFPLGYALGAVMAVEGVLRRRFGVVRWKGRSYR